MNLAILCGGRSAEHDVSLMSTASALQNLDTARFRIAVVGIARDGSTLDAATLRDRLGQGLSDDVEFPEAGTWIGYLAGLDRDTWVVFPLLHGPYGEDGTVQGLLELLDLPYVGAGVGGSAVGMNKIYSKQISEAAGLPVLPWVRLNSLDWIDDRRGVVDRCRPLGFPVFVKPASMGSSVGISKCPDTDSLAAGIEQALRYDDAVIVERGVDAREIEVSVLGNLRAEASVAGEIVPGDEFYSYQAKYLDDSSGLLIPAPLESEQMEAIRKLAVDAYYALQLEGMARVDLLLERENGRIWLNEVNTIPGFTPISMYPKMWEFSGLAYSDLIVRLVELALQRQRRRRRLSTEWQS